MRHSIPSPSPVNRPTLRLVQDPAGTPYDAGGSSLGGYGMIPAAVYALGNGYALAVYAALAKHADNETGECWPSHDTIRKMTGWSKPTVIKAIRALADAGLVEIHEQRDHGMRRVNRYRLPLHQPANGRQSTTLPTLSTSLTQVVNDVDLGSKRRLHELNQRELNQRELERDTPLYPPKGKRARPPVRDGFDRWYAAYPRHEKRAEAERAWAKLPPDAPTTDELIAAVVAQRLADRERRYVPHPSSWLNGRRWDDDPPPPHSAAPPSPNGRYTAASMAASVIEAERRSAVKDGQR